MGLGLGLVRVNVMHPIARALARSWWRTSSPPARGAAVVWAWVGAGGGVQLKVQLKPCVPSRAWRGANRGTAQAPS